MGLVAFQSDFHQICCFAKKAPVAGSVHHNTERDSCAWRSEDFLAVLGWIRSDLSFYLKVISRPQKSYLRGVPPRASFLHLLREEGAEEGREGKGEGRGEAKGQGGDLIRPPSQR